MKEYEVTVVAFQHIEVMADNEEEAMEKAKDELNEFDYEISEMNVVNLSDM